MSHRHQSSLLAWEPGPPGSLTPLASRAATLDGGQRDSLDAALASLEAGGAPRRALGGGGRPADFDADWYRGAIEDLTWWYEDAPDNRGHGRTPVESEEDARWAAIQSSLEGYCPDFNTDAGFASMTRDLERALTDPRPEPSLLALGLRFDDLERRVDFAVDTARRAEARSASQADGGDDERSAPESSASGRLDAIETMLEHVVDCLSDERLAKVLGQSHDPLAAMAPGELDDPAPDAIEEISDRVDELAALLDRAIDEQQRRNEAVMGIMASVQETLLHVLDRLAKSELVETAPEPAAVGPVMPRVDFALPNDRHSNGERAGAQGSLQAAASRLRGAAWSAVRTWLPLSGAPSSRFRWSIPVTMGRRLGTAWVGGKFPAGVARSDG